MPQNIPDPDDPTRLLPPALDFTGARMQHCPGKCDGEDPGYGSFKAAFGGPSGALGALGRYKVGPIPKTQRPIPHTLHALHPTHHTPYITHPTLHTLYTLQPTPYTPCTPHPTP